MLRQLDAGRGSVPRSIMADHTTPAAQGAISAQQGLPSAQELWRTAIKARAAQSGINLGGHAVMGGLAPLPDRSRSLLAAWRAAVPVALAVAAAKGSEQVEGDAISTAVRSSGSSSPGHTTAVALAAGYAASNTSLNSRSGPNLPVKQQAMRLSIVKGRYSFVAAPPPQAAGLGGSMLSGKANAPRQPALTCSMLQAEAEAAAVAPAAAVAATPTEAGAEPTSIKAAGPLHDV